uniref:Uncharacterized protein n=1 Tax=Graphocephala atropunctata TaxID=36148 RepID=A0A1B6KZB6_9HEMI
MTSRFRALNIDLSEESEGENDTPILTKEALEDKASALYSQALQYQANSQWDDAEVLYQQLLESEVLTKVNGRVSFINGRIKPSLEHLKYSCYQNLGHVLVAKNQLENGLECYKKALELDDTNLNLWYKIGLLGMKLVDLNVAISAFEMALDISPRHFPTLDNMISATYAQGGLLSCLHYIARALEYNPKFKKGLALKDRIFKDHPSIREHYLLFDPYPDYKLDPGEVSDVDAAVADKCYHEVMVLREAQRSVSQEQRRTAEYSLPCRPTTWLQLSLLLSATHTQFMEEAPQMDLYRPVNLLSERQFSDVDMEVGSEVDQASADEEVDNINSDAGHEGEDVEPSGVGVRGKRRRSSPTCLEQQPSWMSGKRRSARTRNTSRKEEPTLARTLTNLLPSSLLLESDDGKKDNEVVRWNEDSMDTMDMFRLFGNKDMSEETRETELTNCLAEEERTKIIKEEGYFGTEAESREVSSFLEANSGCDILTLVDRTVLLLSEKWKRHWPTALPAIYVQLYKVYLQHSPPTMTVPSLLKNEEDGSACVLYGELLLDIWLKHGKSRNKPSPLGDSCLGGEFPSLLLGDLHDLYSRSSDPDFIARTLWMHSLLSLYNSEITTAVQKLYLIQNNEKLENVNVRLVNVTNHFIINRSTVETMQTILNRKQMVDEVMELYQRDDCEQIVAILTEVLQPSQPAVGMFQPSLARDAQYSLLLYTLWRLDRDQECLRWAEIFVHESVKQLLAAVAEDNCELRTKWLSMVNNTIICMLACVNYCGTKIFNALEKNRLARLVQSLIHVICRQIESGQVSQTVTGADRQSQEFDIVAPWMLLYSIITHCEETAVNTRAALSAEERLPSSIRLLFTAHEYLGRRAWCCLDEGVILYQILYQLQSLMDLYFLESEEYSVLSQQLEQIFYCLYGHPMKRNKPRYVQEHNVNGLELTWARSHQVLSLLRPKELPTYDSSSKCSISADTETLLQRIIQLVPPETNPKRLLEQMTKYIEGTVDVIPENDKPLSTEMADIYYLIADHYFKAKTMTKALRHYILDVCNNPERVDSWACMALARGSILETKLNSCDALKSESDFLKKAQMSCRCYKTALELDSGLPTLWIEYGSFSYMVHSFCSRLLKQEQNLSLEMFETLETQKESMIQEALHCFTEANKLWYTDDGQEMLDERWLHHYMLGKIAEKKQEAAGQFLSHYMKSLEFLHLNNAMYPSLVTYNSPQNLAVEALELYYRIHAVILKTLEQSEDKPVDPSLRTLFRETLDKVAASSFARKVTRSEESEGANSAKKTIYIDSEETRMATVKRLMDSVVELVEANVDFQDQADKKLEKRSAEPSEQPAKRVKREDSETSDRSKEGKKGGKLTKKNSSESSSDSDSDSESSSSESTSSDSSDDSDDSSEEDKSADDKKEEGVNSGGDKGEWKKDQEYLTTACLDALEECAQRFPEHYKSLYRLAHFYFRSKLRRNVEKARQLLLGEKGLFADRKLSNFFNGVWRIPSTEIDRPGSFASHMSRCVLLLVDVLRHTCDHKMLFDLALHLRDTPEADKKYLRDPEREELSREALSLSVQALRRKLTEAKSEEDQKNILLEIFKVYKRCSKHWELRQGQFVTLLTDAFAQYKEENGGGFDAAVKFCTQEIANQKASAVPTPSSTPHTAFSSPDVSQASSPVPLMPPITAQQKPPPMPTPPVKRGRGRPSSSSLRQQNPNVFKQNYRQSAEGLAQFYRNMVTMQMMNQSKAGQPGAMLNQQMISSAAMALSYQTEMYQQLLLQQQQVQKAAQLQAIKDRAKVSVAPPPTSQQKNDNSSKASSLLAPSKISVFSSQSVLLSNPKPAAKQTSKPHSSLSISPVGMNNPGMYQHGTQPQYTQARAPVQSQPKPSPFQQKMPVEPKVSLQHKLLSAKMGKQITTSLANPAQQQTSVVANSDRSKYTKDKVSSVQKSSAAALSSRGVSITPAKLPDIKIPKDITLGHGLSISPVSSSITKSSLSPSTSKEVTVTLMKSQSDPKATKSSSSMSVSLVDNKKSQLSPGGGRNSPSATLRMGGAITITPAKPAKSTPQVKSIPKADFSISLSKPSDSKKKDGNDVILID